MQTYSHSGAVPIGGAVTTLLASLAAAMIGGFIYAHAFYWIPFVYINFLIALAYGVIIGVTVSLMAKRGHVRNNMFLTLTAIIAGVVGLYFYWASYLWALAGIGRVGLLALWPPTLIEFGEELFQKGSWGIKGANITGWILVAFWIAEAGLILWMATSIALTDAHRPYCESCSVWTNVEQSVARLAATGDEPAWQQVLSGELPSLAAFPPAEHGAKQFVRLDVACCPRCAQSRFLTIHTVQITVDKKDNETTKEKPLVINAILTPSQFAVVEACAELYRQGPIALATEESAADAAPDESQPPTDPPQAYA